MDSLNNIFSKTYTSLPTTSRVPRDTYSPTNPPSPSSKIPWHILKSKQVISIVLITTALLSLLSSRPYLASKGFGHIRFPSKGLKDTLWSELDEIPWRSIILEPTEVPFEEETSQELPVPWSTKAFLPAGSLFDKNGDKLPLPVHQIKVLPRVVLLNNTQEERVQIERMIFGVVTTVARAMEISILWTRWLTPFDESYGFNNVTRNLDTLARPACLVLVSDSESLKDILELRAVLKMRDLRCEVKVSTEPRYEIRVLSMVKELRDYAERINRSFDWYLFGDDDTYWVDLQTLRRMISKYPVEKDWFIGTTTEAQRQLEAFGRMAFGGGGMVLSDPLAKKMYTIWDECYKRFRHVFGGDEMITRCAALGKGATKQTVTTEEKGLHQFDIPGDTTGVFQSGIPFVSLHHYLGGAWVHLFGYGTYLSDMQQINVIAKAISFLGGDNMFKRYIFGDGRWLLVQGYSLTFFEGRLSREDLTMMEHTWYDGYRLSFEDRPVVPERHDAPGTFVKQTFYIDDVKVLSPTRAIFTYIQADKWDEHFKKSDRVKLEVLWDGDATKKQQEESIRTGINLFKIGRAGIGAGGKPRLSQSELLVNSLTGVKSS